MSPEMTCVGWSAGKVEGKPLPDRDDLAEVRPDARTKSFWPSKDGSRGALSRARSEERRLRLPPVTSAAAADRHPEPRDCGRVFGGGIPADVVAEAGEVHGGPGQRVEVPVGRERREEDPQDRSVAAGGVEAEDGLPVGVAYPGGGEGRVEPCRGEPVAWSFDDHLSTTQRAPSSRPTWCSRLPSSGSGPIAARTRSSPRGTCRGCG